MKKYNKDIIISKSIKTSYSRYLKARNRLINSGKKLEKPLSVLAYKDQYELIKNQYPKLDRVAGIFAKSDQVVSDKQAKNWSELLIKARDAAPDKRKYKLILGMTQQQLEKEFLLQTPLSKRIFKHTYDKDSKEYSKDLFKMFFYVDTK